MLDCTRNALAVGLGIAWLAICGVVIIDTQRTLSQGTNQNAAEQSGKSQAEQQDNAPINTSTQRAAVSGNETKSPDQRAGKQQAEFVMSESFLTLSPTAWIAFFTVGILFAAVVQACIYWQMHQANKVIERAYVFMTHTMNGVRLAANNPYDLHINIQFVNGGHTPADIIAINIAFDIAAPINNPERPAIPTNEPINFIMPSDRFEIGHRFPITLEQWNQITGTGVPRLPVLITAWVVYKDRFGHRHRAGYGRTTVEPVHGGANELFFITEPGYNYQEDLD